MSSTRMIFPLFSTPVYVNNVGDFPRPDLDSLTYTSTMPGGGSFNFLSSTDKHVLDRPEFAAVRDIVLREINDHAGALAEMIARPYASPFHLLEAVRSSF
jgi:hypothetical protein